MPVCCPDRFQAELAYISLVKHGEQSPTGTPRDPPLAAHGERQAEELAQYIASLPIGDRPTAIFSSPYYRCLQTSAPVAAALDLSVYVENGVSEWYSPVKAGTGLHPLPLGASSLAASFPALRIDTETWPNPTLIPSRRGESISQVHERCREFLRVFLPRAEQLANGRHKKILLVSHAATVIALTRELVGNRSLYMRVACCSFTTVTRKPEDAAQAIDVWTSRGLAQGEFLSGGLERDWGFEDVALNKCEVAEDPGVPGTEGEDEGSVGLQVASPSARM